MTSIFKSTAEAPFSRSINPRTPPTAAFSFSNAWLLSKLQKLSLRFIFYTFPVYCDSPSGTTIIHRSPLNDHQLLARTAHTPQAGVRNFSSVHSVQIGTGVHPASYPMGTGGSFPLGYSGGGVKLTIHHLVPRSCVVELHLHSPKSL
jgi:hypothetical protein